MAKELSEMTLQELWNLFPIFLVPHDDKWKVYYDEIRNFLEKILFEYPVERISHIGSTAIFGIWAKNIVDVMVEISRCADIDNVAKKIEENGFGRVKIDGDDWKAQTSDGSAVEVGTKVKIEAFESIILTVKKL